ncbi:tail assembly protein [Pluralibacter gergoviae]|uniref:Tail assembly protein n=1 Tax=Pluralibacter gergoviae TaxID=61647 RepID=A0AAI9GH23_PLUGE|nr:tail assembly protein [Pluralibacter gergoviae]EKV9907891.1 tail assembly protein [Pluralibacter gergoviae]EKW7272452.1 tail assembly protein [Pluralibacter gergoviae]ELD4293923.1 tail assembly protein [Pluralibacter gergoviae]ELD4304702.1 tail assembly protein [Pluralibacter gergoviae]
MKEVLTEIELGGVLGKKFGKMHQRFISKTNEAALALAKTIPGFERFMISSEKLGLTYAVFRGKKNLSKDDMGLPSTGEVIRIVPVIIGSKKAGLLQTVLGAALVVIGVVTQQYYIAAAGASMALGGAIQMLSPQPKGLASKQDSDNKASYAFGSVTNTTAQGNPVPLGYGRRRIGGAIISAGIYVEDQQ